MISANVYLKFRVEYYGVGSREAEESNSIASVSMLFPS